MSKHVDMSKPATSGRLISDQPDEPVLLPLRPANKKNVPNSSAINNSLSHEKDVKQKARRIQGLRSHENGHAHDDNFGVTVSQATALSSEDVEGLTRSFDQQLLLVKPSLGLSNDVTVSMTNERRRRFRQFVSERVHNTSETNSIVNNSFNHSEAKELTNFFFAKMVGAGSLSQIATLINEYTSRKKGELEKAVAMGRQNCTPAGNISLLIRQFFSTISWQQYMAHSDNTRLEMLYPNVSKIDALAKHERLKALLKEPHSELRAHLTDRGAMPGPEGTLQTCLMHYLRDQSGLTKNKFRYIMQEGQIAQDLVSEFDYGILCLLPELDPFRLRHFGVQRLRPVYAELRRLVPELVEVSALLRKNLFDPIMAGKEIKVAQVNLSVKDPSLLSRIREAVERGNGKTQIGGGHDPWWD